MIATGLWLSPVRAQETPLEESASATPTNAPAAGPADASETRPRLRRGPLVSIGRDAELTAGDTAEDVVVIGGSAKVHGKVRDNIVVIGGNAEFDGEEAGEVTVIGGDAIVHGKVRHNVVVILGNVRLEPGAEVRRDLVAIGGKVIVSEGAIATGRVQDVDIFLPGFPRLEGLQNWFLQCVIKVRPLAPQVGWVWGVWGAFLLLYLLAAIAFRRPVQASVNQLTARPTTTFLVGLLTKVFLAVIILILAATVVGLLVVPFLLAALAFGLIVGKAAILEYLGGKIGRLSGMELLQKPLAAFLLGAVLITLLYMIPLIGFLTFGVISLWGLGAAVSAAFAGMRRESRPAPSSPTGPGAGLPANVPLAGGVGADAVTAASMSGLPVALAQPRAGFWERMGAALLDVALLAVLVGITGPFIFLVALAYFAGMWAWKGTTIGGIVLKLQVVREDGGPLTFLVALVRALAAAFSAACFFLGFFWIAWDPEKQSWHDKIAGTAVVRLPRSLPLVCL